MNILEDNYRMLKSLRDEIYRLNLNESPSKTDYNNLRDKDTSPASSTVLSRTDLTWSQVMQLIGLKYDGMALQKDLEYIEDGFSQMTQDQKFEYFKNKVIRTGLTVDGWYRVLNIVDEGNSINKQASTARRDRYVSSEFKDLSKEEQLDFLLSYIESNNIINSVDYNARRSKEKTPSLSYINANFGGWKNITEVYTKKYKKEMG